MILLRHTAKVFATISLLFASTVAQDSIYRLEAGTKISVRMDVEINSAVSSPNDTFTVKTANDVIKDGSVLVPAGTVIEGRVTEASAAAVAGKRGTLVLRFERMLLQDGESRSIDASPVRQPRAESTQKTSWLAVIAGTAAGALIGALTRSGSGAAVGAGIGAGAGTGIALARKGKDVRIRSGEVFEIVLNRDVVLPIRDF